VSAFRLKRIRDECYDAGVNAYLPKPFTTEQLEAAPCVGAENERARVLLDRRCIDEIRHIEQVAGRHDMLAGFIVTLERNLAGFPAAFADYIARGDATGAQRAAHTLKGTCHQLGAQALGDLFAEIERSAKAGDYAAAKRTFDAAGSLISGSLEALKQA
jgi:HPt (histidine-containing phosphotransfer) domain-containing protein